MLWLWLCHIFQILDRTWAIASFWVDDAVTIGHQHQLLELEDAFKEQFGLSDEHDIHWMLSTAITQDIDQNLISISQKNNIEVIAVKFQTCSSMTYKTPIPLGIDFTA